MENYFQARILYLIWCQDIIRHFQRAKIQYLPPMHHFSGGWSEHVLQQKEDTNEEIRKRALRTQGSQTEEDEAPDGSCAADPDSTARGPDRNSRRGHMGARGERNRYFLASLSIWEIIYSSIWQVFEYVEEIKVQKTKQMSLKNIY